MASNENDNENRRARARRRSDLASKTSRTALPFSDVPVWEETARGLRLGYRRGRGTWGRGGSWLAASRDSEGKRAQLRLALADDVSAADGATVLDYDQAREAARVWAKWLKSSERKFATVTVASVMKQYLDAREAEGMKSVYHSRRSIDAAIIPALGLIDAAKLTSERIRKWRDSLVTAPKRQRTGKFAAKPNLVAVDLSDADALRKRRETANRLLTMLKAGLNWAFHHGLLADDGPWRKVKPFRNTGAARIHFLSLTEQQRLLNAAQGDIRNLVAAALLTGARFSELARLQVRDFDRDNGSVFIASSKSGKPRHVPLTHGGRALFERLAIARNSLDYLLTRTGKQWTPASYARSFKEALAQVESPHWVVRSKC